MNGKDLSQDFAMSYEDNSTEHSNNSDEEAGTGDELFVQLTDLVRRHYCSYLEKQLWDNITVWRIKQTPKATVNKALETAVLKKCCKLLEDQAIQSCIHARRYQQCMLQIIAEVRQNTLECRLERQLDELLNDDITLRKQHKCTQTENIPYMPVCQKPAAEEEIRSLSPDTISLSLQQKIDIFQKRLNRETATIIAATHNNHNGVVHKKHARNRSETTPQRNHQRKRLRQDNGVCSKNKPRIELQSNNTIKPTTTEILAATSPQTPTEIFIKSELITSNHKSATMIDNITDHTSPIAKEQHEIQANSLNLEQDDQIARELAELFSEEKTELEELLGIEPSNEDDDPQTRSILEEIQNARLPCELKSSHPIEFVKLSKQIEQPNTNIATAPSLTRKAQHLMPLPVEGQGASNQYGTVQDLRQSLWPCELFMQRRRLTSAVNRLIEEDLRWHEVITWKFTALFGEDSDDEFGACSPSIELDEVIIGSCIRRISPWMVKHLMKPMQDGLIANRFLFKKLAKKLAHAIVLEHQYPDERLIKRTVEEFFCLHHAVLSTDDIDDIPNLATILISGETATM